MDNLEFLKKLEKGELRVAQKLQGQWQVNTEIKQRILEVFKTSKIVPMEGDFLDKEPLKVRKFSLEDKVRLVPGGSSVRAGAYVGQNVVIMPPAYINIGAYVGEDSMVDSNVLVGSCAQIGNKVHLSAGVQIGGVLEPIGNRPVIIEDNCFIGAGSVIVEGILVKSRAVIASGVILSSSMPIYDVVNNQVIKGEIPENAVVVAGNRAIKNNVFASEQGLGLSCAIIIKYRDEKTDASIELEDFLRS